MARLGLQQLWIVLASAAPYLMFAGRSPVITEQRCGSVTRSAEDDSLT
ncbi:MAG: hypothetical protein QOE71_665 [Pseudonocardiales bacterium]|nr:hypothetical protein [Pseudonocardiales bacterium]